MMRQLWLVLGLCVLLTWEPWEGSHALPRWCAAGGAGGLPTRLAVAPAGATPAVAPSARLITPAQLKATLASHKGHVVVLHFWATWCLPCLKELPLLAKLAREASSRGIDFLPVSLDDPTERGAALVGRVLAAKTGNPQWSPILNAEYVEDLVADLAPSWDGEIPVFFAYDREGHLRRTLVGNMSRGDFERLVSDLLPPE
jgi:thiol-disulfide isomerase/thioredoxin